jgi:hypothetical protein
MQLIRCTKNLQKRLELTKEEIRDSETSDRILDSWHANLIEIAGSPAMLFANDRTLLNFFIDINPDSPVHHFRKNFVAMVSCILADLDVPYKTREHVPRPQIFPFRGKSPWNYNSNRTTLLAPLSFDRL